MFLGGVWEINKKRRNSLLHDASSSVSSLSPTPSLTSPSLSSNPSLTDPVDIVRSVFGPDVHVSPTSLTGAFSSTYIVSGNIPILKIRQQLRNSVNALHAFQHPKKVLVKIADVYMGRHEAAIMHRIRSTKAERIACRRGAGSLLIPKQAVPAVYAAGELHGKYVIVMEFIEGQPLRSLTHVTPNIAQLFETAVLSTWLAGVIHADLHENNIMVVGGRAPRVVLLDFGMAVAVDGERAQKLRRGICDPDKAFDDPDIKNFIAVHQALVFDRNFVHPDVDALREVSSKIYSSPTTYSPTTYSPYIQTSPHPSPVKRSPYNQKINRQVPVFMKNPFNTPA
jgi:predicted Ser/Thr protein kinase